MRHLLPLALLVAACTAGSPDDAPDTDTPPDRSVGAPGDPGPVRDAAGALVYPAAAAMPALRGPGGPSVTFADDELWEGCAFLTGDADDGDHHNLVATYRGHLVMPWCPEYGIILGDSCGISLFDMSDPCHPVKVGEGTSDAMRETHAMGFAVLPEGDPHAGEWAVVNGLELPFQSGIQFWDLSDVEHPVAVSNHPLEGSTYPDSYTRVTLSVFWQYPYVFAASADLGVFVVDATDPTAPETLAHYTFDQGLRAGGVFALGNLLLVSSAEGEQAAILDVSDPADPQLLPGSPFTITDASGEPRDAYHANLSGHLALFARKEAGGGPIVFDITDPTRPTFVADLQLPGSGGYIFYDEGFLFTGDSSLAHVVDARDWSSLTLAGTGDLPGDLDTLTPYGNVALLAVDEPEDAEGESTAVMPWTQAPDATPPQVLSIEPQDGATGVALTGRVGVGLNEFVEPSSAFAGAIRLWDADGRPVPGWGSAQEAIASFAPKTPLDPGTTYTIEVVAGGLRDLNGHALDATVTSTFTTAE